MRSGAPPSERPAIDTGKRSGLGAINGIDNLADMRFNHWPAHGGQGYQSDPPGAHVLLVVKRSVARHQNVESGILGGVRKFTVLQATLAHISHDEGAMLAEECPQIVGDVFVEQYLHGTSWCLWAKARILRIVSIESVG